MVSAKGGHDLGSAGPVWMPRHGLVLAAVMIATKSPPAILLWGRRGASKTVLMHEVSAVRQPEGVEGNFRERIRLRNAAFDADKFGPKTLAGPLEFAGGAALRARDPETARHHCGGGASAQRQSYSTGVRLRDKQQSSTSSPRARLWEGNRQEKQEHFGQQIAGLPGACDRARRSYAPGYLWRRLSESTGSRCAFTPNAGISCSFASSCSARTL